ncbi:MAG: hypothetical protein ABI614_16300, partial [Planctomycetota bacterium]
MSSKISAVLRFSIVAWVAITGQQAFGQAAPGAGTATNAPFTVLPIVPAFQPIDPDIVASNEAAATEDAKRARERTVAFSNARKVLAGQIPCDDAGKKTLDAWYKGYFLPTFTSPETRGALPEWRDTLINKDLRTARSPEATAYLRGQVMTYMKAFAQSPPPKYNFHPAVRYNAMLVIGDLNAV